MEPYLQMKDSGIPWLGFIPAHWNLRRMKTLLAERVEKCYPDEPLLAATQSQGVVTKDRYEGRTVLALNDLHLLKLVRKGDFVISLRSFQGGIEVARDQGIISPAYTILYALHPHSHAYLSRLFKSGPFIDNLGLHVTGIRQGQNVDYAKLSRAAIPWPPPAEQDAIVRFLSHLDAALGRHLRAKQALIRILNEQGQAIVERVVTRGLSQNIALRPSETDWLGEVPAHWEMRRAKHSYREVDERSTTGSEEQLSVSHITGITPRSEKNVTMFKPESYVGHKLCNEGDLVINTMWAWAGALGISKMRGIVSPSYAVYRPRTKSFSSEFVDAMLRTPAYISEYNRRSTGVTKSRLRLYPEQFLSLPLLQPPMNEQLAIVDYIRTATKGVRAAIAGATNEIALLSELRTRLSADVVTGKFDVREAAARLPEESKELEQAETDSFDASADRSLEDFDETQEEGSEFDHRHE
jgi:type I restriction enzyme, S subunit